MHPAVIPTVELDRPRHEKSRQPLRMSTALYATGSIVALISGLAPSVIHIGQAAPNIPGVGDLSDKGIAVAGIVSAVGLGMLALYDNFRSRKRKHDSLDLAEQEKGWPAEKRRLNERLKQKDDQLEWCEERIKFLDVENQRLQAEINRVYVRIDVAEKEISRLRSEAETWKRSGGIGPASG
jgi:hypothetical protein